MAVQWRQDSSVYKRYIREIVTVYQQRSDIRAFLEILLSVFAIFIFGVFAIRPTLVTIANLNGEIESKKETLSQMNTKIDNLVAAQQLYESKRGLITLLSTAVPATSDPLNFAEQLDRMTKKDSVSMINLAMDAAPLIGTQNTPLDPTAVEGASPDLSIPISITVEGEFSDIETFLSDFESMRRPVQPASLLVTLSAEKDSTKISLTVAGKIPYIQ